MDRELYIIANKFTKDLGARYRDQGTNSGQEFFEDYLKAIFGNIIKENKILVISFDGVNGHPPSFLDEAFGLLSCGYGKTIVLKHLDIIYSRGEWLKDKIINIIETAETKRRPDDCKRI